MRKILYIVPGFGEYPTDPAYTSIKKMAKKRGYGVIFATINWPYNSISSWINDFEKTLTKIKSDNITVLGFSFGAMLTLIVSEKYSFKKIILCSPSPYFKEDISFIPQSSKKWVGKRRLADFSKHSFPKKGTTPAVFIMGDKDWKFGIKRLKERFSLWKGKKTIKILEGVEHYIGHKLYQKEINKLL